MRIIDITLPLSPALPVWPGDPRISVTRVMSLAGGDVANVSRLSCIVHAGTHVDAPCHFVEGGATVDRLSLEILIGPALAVHLPGIAEVDVGSLERLEIPPQTQRLLLRTRNSELWVRGIREFTPDYVALTPEAAQWMVDRGIRLLGVDYLSVQRFRDREPTTHRTLLGAGVIVIEGLDLHNVAAGPYRLVCLPLNIPGCDGAPARAVLLEE